jgi:hypothetical protein
LNCFFLPLFMLFQCGFVTFQQSKNSNIPENANNTDFSALAEWL